MFAEPSSITVSQMSPETVVQEHRDRPRVPRSTEDAEMAEAAEIKHRPLPPKNWYHKLETEDLWRWT